MWAQDMQKCSEASKLDASTASLRNTLGSACLVTYLKEVVGGFPKQAEGERAVHVLVDAAVVVRQRTVRVRRHQELIRHACGPRTHMMHSFLLIVIQEHQIACLHGRSLDRSRAPTLLHNSGAYITKQLPHSMPNATLN